MIPHVVQLGRCRSCVHNRPADCGGIVTRRKIGFIERMFKRCKEFEEFRYLGVI